MKIKQEFFGFSPVMWMGVVEDINDPIKLGRVKVRIFGWHTQSTGGGQPAVPAVGGAGAGGGSGANVVDEAHINDTEYARAYFFNFGIDVNDTTTYPPNQVPPADRASRGFPVAGGDLAGLVDENGNPVAPPMSQIPELASGKGKGGSGGGGGGSAPFGEGGGGGAPSGEDVPVGDLPWAHVMQSTTFAPNSGTGGPMTRMQQGTWVMGMFLDGEIGREPIVMGSIPGIPMELSKGPKEGFYDPEAVWPRETESWKIEEPDTNRLARNDNVAMGDPKDYPHKVIDKKKNRQHKTVFATGYTLEEPVLDSWADFKAKYPDNKTLETKSGHIFEIDDTPKFERIHIYHKNGSYIEMGGACGPANRIDKVTGDWFTMIDRNWYKAVGGDVHTAGRHVSFNTQTFVAMGKSISFKSPNVVATGKITAQSLHSRTGASDTFIDVNGKVVTVAGGIVISIGPAQ